MDDKFAKCFASSFPHPDGGWAYTCRCGYESRPGFTQIEADTYARSHESLTPMHKLIIASAGMYEHEDEDPTELCAEHGLPSLGGFCRLDWEEDEDWRRF